MENVNHPKHYNQGGIECIDVMQKIFGTIAVQQFCLLNAFKYLFRCSFKGKKEEDIDKAMWYLTKYKDLNEK